MIHEKIGEIISEAMKSGDKVKLQVVRLMKNKFLIFEKSEEFSEWSEVKETTILMKMAAEREDSIEQYTKANRLDLAENEKKELEIIKEYLPKQATEEEISEYTEEVIKEMKDGGNAISMKDMKYILSKVQEKYPTANGKIVSIVLKNNI